MKAKYLYPCLLLLALLAAGCKKAAVPEQSTPVAEKPVLYPDYRGVTVPPNIAPLNFRVEAAGSEFVAAVSAGGRQMVAAADGKHAFRFDEQEWHALLQAAAGDSLSVRLYARREGGWVSFPAFAVYVAREPIDRYLSYRLIEPGYELYRQLGIYQRDLTGFEEKAVYENNRSYSPGENHCVNCHNFQNHDAGTFLFHVRAAHGGTVFVKDGKIHKVNMQNDSLLSAAVYPAWHPSRPWLVFSTNLTGQAFHLVDPQRVEVIDSSSDLVFYDEENNTISPITRTDDVFETFPCWAPDGKRVYYCRALLPYVKGLTGGARIDTVLKHSRAIRYDLMSIPFDARTRHFGEPRVELDAAAIGKSVTLPRVSPDGRYVLFGMGDYGQFHIWHKSADLYVKDLHTGRTYPLTAANSPDVESYHAWSSNGRWIVFASRRDDGNFSRVYIAYFDRNGQARKAFLLPQADPDDNLRRLKSYNVPELTRNAVSVTPETLRSAIYDTEGQRATYVP